MINLLTDHEDVNKIYSDFEEAFIQTVDKHTPVKQRKPCQTPTPFINKEFRKAVYKKKSQLVSCIINIINVKLRVTGKIRQQRNLVTKIKKNFIKSYFFERCIGHFRWSQIKGFLAYYQAVYYQQR